MAHSLPLFRRPVRARILARFGGVLAALVVLLSGWGISTAAAASVAPSAAVGAIGHDVSTPQCGRTLPEIGAFGVVGVNGGRAFTENPCFATEHAWAKRRPAASGVYVNTGNPAPRSDFYWPASGSRVGLYSTAYQWRTITGGYTASSAAGYRTAWRPAFTPRYRLESAPLWIAIAGDLAAAKAACSTSFTGAAAQMVQFVDGSGLDANYVCRRA